MARLPTGANAAAVCPNPGDTSTISPMTGEHDSDEVGTTPDRFTLEWLSRLRDSGRFILTIDAVLWGGMAAIVAVFPSGALASWAHALRIPSRLLICAISFGLVLEASSTALSGLFLRRPDRLPLKHRRASRWVAIRSCQFAYASQYIASIIAAAWLAVIIDKLLS